MTVSRCRTSSATTTSTTRRTARTTATATTPNFSWNYGVEGPTDDPAIVSLRDQQKRNLLATLLLSLGVPMLLAGDEFGHTQGGNNNAYCQDNEISWLDWENIRPEDEALRDSCATWSICGGSTGCSRGRASFAARSSRKPGSRTSPG